MTREHDMVTLREIVIDPRLEAPWTRYLGHRQTDRPGPQDRTQVSRTGNGDRPVRARQPRPRLLDPYTDHLSQRIAAFPGLSGRRLWREIAGLGYSGGGARRKLQAIKQPAARVAR